MGRQLNKTVRKTNIRVSNSAILSARERHEPFEIGLRGGITELVPEKGLTKEHQDEVIKSNFLHTPSQQLDWTYHFSR